MERDISTVGIFLLEIISIADPNISVVVEETPLNVEIIDETHENTIGKVAIEKINVIGTVIFSVKNPFRGAHLLQIQAKSFLSKGKKANRLVS